MNKFPLGAAAKELESHGRYGDTMMIHVNPVEVAGLASLTPGGLTTNPVTGQLEAFNFMETVLPIAATVVGTMYGGPMGGAAANAAVTTAVTGDYKRGIASGLMGYGIGSALGAAGGAAADAATGEVAKEAAATVGTVASTSAATGGIGAGGLGLESLAVETATEEAAKEGFMKSAFQRGPSAGDMFSNPGNLVKEMASPGAALPFIIGSGMNADLKQNAAWDAEARQIQGDRDEKLRQSYGDLQGAYAQAQPNAMRGVSPHRAGMSQYAPPPWRPPGYARGGMVVMPQGGQIPYYNFGQGSGVAQYKHGGVLDPNFNYDDYKKGGKKNKDYAGEQQGPDYGGIDPVTIQANLRGQRSVAPPSGYMAGFNPEFNYFQNGAPGDPVSSPAFKAPWDTDIYAGSPINNFQQGGGNTPYFESVLPQTPPPAPVVPPTKGGGSSIGLPPVDPGYADGGDIKLNASMGDMTVAPGGVASLQNEYTDQPQPTPEDIQGLSMAITSQVPQEQADQIINMFIEKYGNELFTQLRDQILQSIQPNSQTQGMMQGPGGGMDDMIQGTIGGQQDVALSAGEFVVPADVVSGLGSGSSDAGAAQLEQMMNKVRKARGGKITQPPKIDPKKMLPV